ncbi:MAG: DNA polymerase III subunit beta [Clostridia bacterium]|nr:DNA polymerase III subunit beta [Clostridia bacterium]
MKIIVNGLDLNEAIAKVSKALPSRDVSPVLECIKVTAENDKMTLFATDKDLAIEKTIDANVIVSGAFLVPGRVFCDYIRSIANETDISLEMTDENRLEICTSGSECNIATLDLDDYPEMEEIGGPNYFAVQESSLKEIINNVIFAVATDDTRPMLKGVNFEAENYTLTAVATDGYRFAMSKKALEEKTPRITATVPSRSLNELAKLLGDSENVIKVHIDKSYLMVSLENTRLMTRLLINGQYIKYDNIIPKEFVSTLVVNKENFEKSLNTASIMSRGDKNNLVLLDIEEYCMNISSTSQYGTIKENVTVSLRGKDVRCAYNAKYINDCLKVIDAETIKMEFALHNSCVITINGSDEVLYFILPVKQIG